MLFQVVYSHLQVLTNVSLDILVHASQIFLLLIFLLHLLLHLLLVLLGYMEGKKTKTYYSHPTILSILMVLEGFWN